MRILKKFCPIIFFVFMTGCSLYSADTILPRYLKVKHGQIQYVRFGKGSPVVVINGYTGDIAGWDRRFLMTLAAQHDLIVFNNRNVGCSCISSNAYKAQDLAHDTYELIRGLHLKRPAILGFSLGGIIAQEYVVQHPDHASKLILINTLIAGPQGVLPDKSIQQKLYQFPSNPVSRLSVSLQLFFPPGWRARALHSLLLHRFMPAQYPFDNYPSRAVLDNQLKLVFAWHQDILTGKLIKNIAIATLILNGEADIIVPPVNSIILASTIRHAELMRWKQGGHAMEFQYPVEMANAINQFLANEGQH